MNNMADRVKLRQVYQDRKTRAYGLALIMGLLAIFPAWWSFSLLIPTLRHYSPYHHFGDSLLGFEISGFLILMALLSLLSSGLLVRDALSIPCVPPAPEQVGALPDESILLRGSQATPAAPGELLRPAASQEMPAEDLLRPTSGDRIA